MFGWKRNKRKQQTAEIKAMVARATDPRRQVMAGIVEHVLTQAGFSRLPVNKHGFAVDRDGFWMRVDSIGPGILLTYVGGPLRGDAATIANNAGIAQLLQQAFAQALGEPARQLISVQPDTDGDMFVLIPDTDSLQHLRQVLGG